MLLRIAGPMALLGWLIGSVIFGFLATTTTRWALLGLIANTLVWGLVICAFRCPVCRRPVHLKQMPDARALAGTYAAGANYWSLFMVDRCEGCGTDVSRERLSRRTFGLSRNLSRV